MDDDIDGNRTPNKVDVTKPEVNKLDDVRQRLSAVLTKWSMPTRQAALNEIEALIDTHTRQARIEELAERLSDLSYACELTNNAPLLANELEVVKQRLEALQPKEAKK